MDKYQQQREAHAEASTNQERFEENNTVHIDIPDRTKFSPDGTLGSLEEMKTSSSSIDLGFTATLESNGGEYLMTSKDMKHTSECLPTGMLLYAEAQPLMSVPPLVHTESYGPKYLMISEDMEYISEMHSRETPSEESPSKIETPTTQVDKSPLLAAIMKQEDTESLDLILKEKPSWVTETDTEGRTPLHYAASIGYLSGVQYLLSKCASCAIERDNHGYFPLHLASDGGHVEVVKELLEVECCLNPRELLDNGSRNFLHLAVASGKFSVVRFILKSTDKELGEMINDQDANGNTPLHLATLRCHPKIVQALTWDKRVKPTLVNKKNQTALDVCSQTSLQNPSLRQRLTWVALKSAGVPYADPLPRSIKVPSQSTESLWKKEAPNMDQYKDRINTLILVSTLIITVTFAAGFTLPGGVKSSDPGQGMALMLHRMLFKVFIFCITISMYGAISVTIILIWAQLGDLTMAILALHVAKYCLGVTLATLSLAFLTGVHLVISDLSWLATTTLIMSITFILMLLLLYILLWLPSTSSTPIVRLISYYPFLMLASLVERPIKGAIGVESYNFEYIHASDRAESKEVNAGNNATKEDIGAQS